MFHWYLTDNSRNNGTQTWLVNISYYTRAPSCPLGHCHITNSPSLAMAFLQNCSPGKESPSLRQQRQNTAEFLSYVLCLQGFKQLLLNRIVTIYNDIPIIEN